MSIIAIELRGRICDIDGSDFYMTPDRESFREEISKVE